MSRGGSMAKRGATKAVGWVLLFVLAVMASIAILLGPTLISLWAGVAALNPDKSSRWGVITAVLCVVAACLSERRVRRDLRDEATRKRLAEGQLGAEAAQIATVIMPSRNPMMTMSIGKSFKGTMDIADRISCWATPYFALTATGLATGYAWAYALVLGLLAVFTLARRTAAAQREDFKVRMLRVARLRVVLAAGVATGAGWFVWTWVASIAGSWLQTLHTNNGWLGALVGWGHMVGRDMEGATFQVIPAIAAALIGAGWIAGLDSMREQVKATQDRAGVASRLAKALNTTDKIMGEVRWTSARDAFDIVVYGPLPAAVIISVADLEPRVAEYLAEYEIAQSDSTRIHLIEASPETQAARLLVLETEGLVLSVRVDGPDYPQPTQKIPTITAGSLA